MGDRLENDIRPADKVGMKTALVRRGPWATIQWDDPEAVAVPTFRVHSLAELPGLVAGLNAEER